MPTVKVDNGKVQLYYELHGEGEQKILFIMGLGASGYAWLPNVQWITQNHPEFQSCIFDNRGIGKSDVPKGRYTTTTMAKDALDLADFLGWHKFHVVGISMGGMISQELTLLAKDRIISLCLGVTHSGGPGSFPPMFKMVRRVKIAGSLGILKNLSKTTIEERAPGTVDVLFSKKYLAAVNEDGRSNREFQIERIIELGKMVPLPSKQGMRSQLLAVQTHSVGSRRLNMIKARQFPLQVIVATEDLLVSPKASYFLRDALKADDFIVFEGCGHGINSERFDDYNASLIRNFRAGFHKLQSQSEPILNGNPHQPYPLHVDQQMNSQNFHINNNNFNDYNDYNEVHSPNPTPLSVPKLESEYESSAY